MKGSPNNNIDYSLKPFFTNGTTDYFREQVPDRASAPCIPDRDYACALILYFEYDEDRDMFMDLMEENDPTMVMKPLDRDEMV